MTKDHFYEMVRCLLLFFILCLLGVCYYYHSVNAELRENNELQKQIINVQNINFDLQSSVTTACHNTLMNISLRLGIDPNNESLPLNQSIAYAKEFSGIGGDFPEGRKHIRRGKTKNKH